MVDLLTGKYNDTEYLGGLIRDSGFDAIINWTAIINQMAEQNKEKTVYVNFNFPYWLEKITAESKTVVI